MFQLETYEFPTKLLHDYHATAVAANADKNIY